MNYAIIGICDNNEYEIIIKYGFKPDNKLLLKYGNGNKEKLQKYKYVLVAEFENKTFIKFIARINGYEWNDGIFMDEKIPLINLRI